MANKRDYYEVLGISKSATEQEIKRAFRRLAMQYHPDRNKEANAEAKFKEINEAYEVLGDEQKRRSYDQYGHEGLNQQGFAGGANPFDIFNQFFSGGGGGGVKFDFGGDDDNDLGDIFGSMFGGNRRSKKRERSLYDVNIEANVTISFLDSILGAKRIITYDVKKECSECHGTGASNDHDAIQKCPKCNGTGTIIQQTRTMFGIMQSQSICPHCNGTGKIIKKVCPKCRGQKYMSSKEQIELDIPAGIINGTQMQFANKGNELHGRRGILYLNVFVQPSKIFKRRDNDLFASALVDPIMAITGGVIKIPTPYGIKEVELKSNTANGEQITVSGMGIKNIKHRMFNVKSNGDLFITIVYARPIKYSSEDIKKLKQINNNKNPEIEEYNKVLSKELG
jgi:molecular chaperone DnaJ